MQQELADHLQTGELRQVGSEFFCNICDVSLGQQPLPHVKGALHKNKVFLLNLRDRGTKYPGLYQKLDSSIRQALDNNVIYVEGLQVICEACGRTSLSGEAPTSSHIAKKSHKTKTEIFLAQKIHSESQNVGINVAKSTTASKQPSSPVSPVQYDSVDQGYAPEFATAAAEDPLKLLAFRKKHIKVISVKS